MGCVVNGPGEAREADLGVASGNGKGQIFVKGEVIKTVPESQIVETLIEEAMRIADEMGEAVPRGLAGGHRQLSGSRARVWSRGSAAVSQDACVLRSSVRVLGRHDVDEALALCAGTPSPTSSWPPACTRARQRGAGGEFWGWYDGGELRSLCWSGANLVPVEATPEALDVFADRARRQGRQCSSIVGPGRRRARRCGSSSSRSGGRRATSAPSSR